MLICSPYVLTFYPASYPSTADPLVLQSSSHYLDESSPLAGGLEQLIQRADYYRGSTPDFWTRGNKTATLDWEEIRLVAGPAAALAAALDVLETLPATTGWLHLYITALARAWAVAPCAIRSVGWRHQARAGKSDILRLRWHLDAGAIAEIAVTPTAYALTLETGYDLLTEPGADYLALESAP